MWPGICSLLFRVVGDLAEVGHPLPPPEFLSPEHLYASVSKMPSLREPGGAWLGWSILKAKSVCWGQGC